jgi:3-oxoacyl-ACP reductase-like protein
MSKILVRTKHRIKTAPGQYVGANKTIEVDEATAKKWAKMDAAEIVVVAKADTPAPAAPKAPSAGGNNEWMKDMPNPLTEEFLKPLKKDQLEQLAEIKKIEFPEGANNALRVNLLTGK